VTDVTASLPQGRVFVCGDIHGCYFELQAKLDELGFDRQTDKLFALGDLVDRGPESERCVRLLDEPWFSSIKGNHEVLMVGAANGGDPEMLGCHLINGGGWFTLLDQTERDELAEMVAGLPIALTVTTPSGRRIGLVHAEPVGNDWDAFMAMIDTPQVQDFAMWTRDRVRHDEIEPIRGVDMVYMGHTPLKEPRQRANMRWIDTGCFATGKITVEELL
jgi:serine/threonine protein phosphatase 1